MHDPVRQVRVAAHLLMEPRIGRDDRILLLNRQRKIEAVVDRMVEINRQPGGRRNELTHGGGNHNRRCSQHIRGIGKILTTDVATAMHGPQCVADFGEEEFRSNNSPWQKPRCIQAAMHPG